MAQDLKSEGKNLASFLDGLSEEQIAEGNRESFEQAQDEYKRFKAAFSNGYCYLCGKPNLTFSKNNPCIHWLLKPKGFKNKFVELITEKYGFFQIQSLLRWYANEESFAKNINDLKDEGSGKLFEVTIKYKHLKWSFSCSESDYQGHSNSFKGKNPHYHFQMQVDKQAFISFNQNHMPFSKMDIINIEAMRANPDKIKQRFSFGEGIADFFNEDILDDILNGISPTDSEDEAAYSIDSLVLANSGSKIKGEDLYKIIKEAKEKGVTVASLLNKLPNTSTRSIVSPGPGVVEQTTRTKRK